MLKENPFHTPTDEEIFILRDLDRKKRLEERRRNEQLSVQEKKTWASRMSSSSRSVKLDDFIEEAPTATDRRTKKMHGLVSATNAAIAKDRRKEKENMSEFIAKKRDMFLVQMALDTKRAEIRKLEEQASQREEVLPSPALDAVVMDPKTGNWPADCTVVPRGSPSLETKPTGSRPGNPIQEIHRSSSARGLGRHCALQDAIAVRDTALYGVPCCGVRCHTQTAGAEEVGGAARGGRRALRPVPAAVGPEDGISAL
jgi:hypothetical protein